MKRKTLGALAVLVLAAMVLALYPAAALPGTYTWNGGTGDWSSPYVNPSNPGNWSPASDQPPNAARGDTAIVDGKGGVASVVNLSSQYGSPSINRLEINSGDEVRTFYNAALQFTFGKLSGGVNPTLVNDGIFRLANTGSFSQSIYASSPTTISGTGRLIMESSTTSRLASESYGFYNQAGHTIEGVGTIEPYWLSNYGMVQAKGDRLLMLANFYNFTGGVLGSSPGAVLQMGLWINANSGLGFSYDGRGGVIDLNGGTVRANLASFINADFRNSGAPGGILELNKSLPLSNSFNFTGNTAVGAGVVVNVGNSVSMFTNSTIAVPAPTITNNGVINLMAASGGYSDFSGPSTTLTGSGRLVLNGNVNSRVLGGSSSSTSLTNDVDHTIEGGGMLSGRIVNNGTILANNSNLLVLGNISGTGQVKVQNGGRLIAGQTGYSPITLQTKDLLMSNIAAITVGFSSTVNVSGNFSYAMTNGTGWSWASDSVLSMTGTGPGHFLEVGGDPNATNPFAGNFYIPKLVIAGDATLVDLIDNQTAYAGHETLYVGNLSFAGSSLNLNDLSLFVWDGSAFDPVEVGDYEGRVFNQAVVIPVPPTMLLLGSGLLSLVGWRRLRRS
ncbi:MAG: hypothetical protein WC443_01600 [Desulfobaccales bacterium]